MTANSQKKSIVRRSTKLKYPKIDFDKMGFTESAIDIYKIDERLCYRDWMKYMPYLKVPADCEIRISPPLGMQLAKISIRRGEVEVHAILECDIGFGLEPIWTIYPYGDDTACVDADQPDRLMELVEHALDMNDIKRNKPNKCKEVPRYENL